MSPIPVPRPRGSRFFACVVRLLLVPLMALTFAVGLGTTPAAASSPGTGGWYWPTGTEKLGDMGPWWQYRGTNWHLAKDIGAPAGRKVYAVGSGTVLESRDIRGYGPGGSAGGAMVILHKTATGREFKALYGHVSNRRYKVGEKVKAGATIATVNNCSPNHLHFGIHPGARYPSDGNVFRGHTYTAKKKYGWVNPVAYLKRNPRLIPYAAPALPIARSIDTTSVPTEVRVSEGRVSWTESSEEGTQTWSAGVAGGEVESLQAAETSETCVDERYRVSVRSDPPGLIIRDALPKLSVRPATTTPRRGRAVSIEGTVKNSAGKAFKGATVLLERRVGDEWIVATSGLSGLDGAYLVRYAPSRRTTLRVRFVPPRTYTAATSTTFSVAPKVSLGSPRLSADAPKAGRSLKIRSTLKPKSFSGTRAEFRVERRVGSRWVRVATPAARITTDPTASTLSASVKLTSIGSYRVRAFSPANQRYAATASKWTAFRVE